MPHTPSPSPQLCIGPLQYWWPRAALMQLYADLAEGPAHTLVLGEVCCSRRNEFSLADWLALAQDLRSAGKTVRLATLPLLMSEAELRVMRRIVEQQDFAVEAGDVAALQAWRHRGTIPADGPGLVLGPHLNLYSQAALAAHLDLGAHTWVAPLELPLDAVARINPPQDQVLRSEVFGFGRMPLAFSARCFTARHHHLSKEQCEFRCRDDADGLLLRSSDGQDFLALNGIQTQSAGLHCLIGAGPQLQRSGVSLLRLSPCSGGFAEVVQLFDEVLSGRMAPAQGLAGLRELPLPGTLVDGFAHRRAGMAALELPQELNHA